MPAIRIYTKCFDCSEQEIFTFGTKFIEHSLDLKFTFGKHFKEYLRQKGSTKAKAQFESGSARLIVDYMKEKGLDSAFRNIVASDNPNSLEIHAEVAKLLRMFRILIETTPLLMLEPKKWKDAIIAYIEELPQLIEDRIKDGRFVPEIPVLKEAGQFDNEEIEKRKSKAFFVPIMKQVDYEAAPDGVSETRYKHKELKRSKRDREHLDDEKEAMRNVKQSRTEEQNIEEHETEKSQKEKEERRRQLKLQKQQKRDQQEQEDNLAVPLPEQVRDAPAKENRNNQAIEDTLPKKIRPSDVCLVEIVPEQPEIENEEENKNEEDGELPHEDILAVPLPEQVAPVHDAPVETVPERTAVENKDENESGLMNADNNEGDGELPDEEASFVHEGHVDRGVEDSNSTPQKEQIKAATDLTPKVNQGTPNQPPKNKTTSSLTKPDEKLEIKKELSFWDPASALKGQSSMVKPSGPNVITGKAGIAPFTTRTEQLATLSPPTADAMLSCGESVPQSQRITSGNRASHSQIDGMSDGNAETIGSQQPVVQWGINRVAEELSKMFEPEIVDKFRQNQIDGRALLLLSTDLLMKHLGMPLGPAIKVVDLVNTLKNNNTPGNNMRVLCNST